MNVIYVTSTLPTKGVVFDRFWHPTQTHAALLYSMSLVCLQAFNEIMYEYNCLGTNMFCSIGFYDDSSIFLPATMSKPGGCLPHHYSNPP